MKIHSNKFKSSIILVCCLILRKGTFLLKKNAHTHRKR
jgi:hypothetical protein